MDEFLKVYEYVERIGFPALFIYGALQGWWYLRPHVEALVQRIGELTAESQRLEEAAQRAAAIAEQGNAVAARAVELTRENQVLLEQIRTDVKILLDRKG